MNGSKAEEISSILRDEILRGQYRAGERLPSERDLAARFVANRGAVREAIKKLEQLGIVDVQPGGVRIVAIEDATLGVLGHLLDLEDIPNQTLILQVFEVIGAIMSLSVRSAVKNASDDQIEQLRQIVKNLIISIDQDEEYYTGWQSLADYLSEINQNLVLRLILNGVKAQFVPRMQDSGLRPNFDRQQDLKYLHLIDTAFADRDQQASCNAILGHYQVLKEGVFGALEHRHEESARSVTHA